MAMINHADLALKGISHQGFDYYVFFFFPRDSISLNYLPWATSFGENKKVEKMLGKATTKSLYRLSSLEPINTSHKTGKENIGGCLKVRPSHFTQDLVIH